MEPRRLYDPRFSMGIEDNDAVATFIGWTDICCRDGFLLYGHPPEEWLSKNSPRWAWNGSAMRRIKKAGEDLVPGYCHNSREFYWAERKIEELGMIKAYEAWIDIVVSTTPSHRTWNCLTMMPEDRAAALLLCLGNKILTYREQDIKEYPQLSFKVIDPAH